jgi:hypothetical protein
MEKKKKRDLIYESFYRGELDYHCSLHHTHTNLLHRNNHKHT